MATTEQAQEVVAGRELDAVIAEMVIGLPKALISINGSITAPGRTYAVREIDCYSTDRAAALDVVDRLQALGLYVAINTTCDAGLYDVEVTDGTHFQALGCAVFKPLPLGICLAAREAVERLSQTRETRGEEERGYPSFSDGGMPLG